MRGTRAFADRGVPQSQRRGASRPDLLFLLHQRFPLAGQQIDHRFEIRVPLQDLLHPDAVAIDLFGTEEKFVPFAVAFGSGDSLLKLRDFFCDLPDPLLALLLFRALFGRELLCVAGRLQRLETRTPVLDGFLCRGMIDDRWRRRPGLEVFHEVRIVPAVDLGPSVFDQDDIFRDPVDEVAIV